MAGQEDLWGGLTEGRPPTLEMLEAWLEEEASAPWLDGYRFLRAQGVRHRYAMLAVWLSLIKDDRGSVGTREEFARLMGVARATTYQWEERKPIRKWAELLRIRRMLGARLAEVDERTYDAAVDGGSSAADRKLYYQRAGVWEEESWLHLVGDEGGPVQFSDVTDDELEAVRKALMAEAPGGGQAG